MGFASLKIEKENENNPAPKKQFVKAIEEKSPKSNNEELTCCGEEN